MNAIESRRWRHGDPVPCPNAGERGSAVVSALMVAALVAAIGATLLVAQEAWIAQQGHLRDRQTARELMHTALHWARAILYDDRARGEVDHAGETWAHTLPPIDFEGARISGHIEDAQARFNLNSLAPGGRANNDAIAAYERLLDHLGLPSTLAQATADWIDSDSETRVPGGAENEYYLALPNPRRAADAPLIDIDELLWVRGHTPAIIERLRPHVIALPSVETINVNTATVEVLAAITALPLADVRQFVAVRETEPVTKVADLPARLPAGPLVARALLGVGSRYFLAHGRVRKGAVRLGLTALLDRNTAGSAWPLVVWQRLE